MKSLEEMTDQELAAEWSKYPFPDNSDHAKLQQIIFDRLSAQPAQRIADLTGLVVTKDMDGKWYMWHWSYPADKLFAETPNWIYAYGTTRMYIPDLPDDNLFWKESIYKPQVNVKNGGKDESTSAG